MSLIDQAIAPIMEACRRAHAKENPPGESFEFPETEVKDWILCVAALAYGSQAVYELLEGSGRAYPPADLEETLLDVWSDPNAAHKLLITQERYGGAK